MNELCTGEDSLISWLIINIH